MDPSIRTFLHFVQLVLPQGGYKGVNIRYINHLIKAQEVEASEVFQNDQQNHFSTFLSPAYAFANKMIDTGSQRSDYFVFQFLGSTIADSLKEVDKAEYQLRKLTAQSYFGFVGVRFPESRFPQGATRFLRNLQVVPRSRVADMHTAKDCYPVTQNLLPKNPDPIVRDHGIAS